jgi:hypothetical protein
VIPRSSLPRSHPFDSLSLDRCQNEVCVGTEQNVCNTSAADPVCGVVCNEGAQSCGAPKGTPCDDLDFCTEVDECDQYGSWYVVGSHPISIVVLLIRLILLWVFYSLISVLVKLIHAEMATSATTSVLRQPRRRARGVA